ncbi:MAG: recombinase RecQ [Aeromicrobium sp.]|nr:recombinase RecQ [Aeromicrobium sp.]
MPTASTDTEALDALRTLTGRDDAVFHEGQLEAIQALVDDRRRALVVQRTVGQVGGLLHLHTAAPPAGCWADLAGLTAAGADA